MSDNDKNDLTKKLLKKVGDAYENSKSYKFKINDGGYWKKVEQFKEFQELVKKKLKS